jgi:uncharacterized protein YvpB
VISRKTIVFAFVLAILSISSLSVHPVNAIPESNMLNVPYHSQFESGDPNSGIFCAPTSVEMVLEYISGQMIPQTTLAVEMKTGPADNGTGVQNVHIPFDNRGYTAVTAASHLTVDDLKAQNAMGYVSIINIWFDTDHKSGHYVVVTGYNATGIYVNDPAWGYHPTSRSAPWKNAFISNTVLNDLWTHKNQWALKIQYPGKVSTTATGASTFPVYSATFSVQSPAGTRYRCYFNWFNAYLLAGNAIGFVIVSSAPVDFYFLTDSDYKTWNATTSCGFVPGALIVQRGIQSYNSTASSDGMFSINQDRTFYFLFINSSPATAKVTFNVIYK